VTKRPPWILPAIILSQFAGTSIWFASNAVLGDLRQDWGLAASSLGYMTVAVQFGFVCGTLTFAFLAISDRHSPRNVFLASCLLGAISNLAIPWLANGLWSLLLFRFLSGFFIAGIYPVGMKIAAGWYREDLGKAIGFLVGALVLGTAFPHLLRGLGQHIPWEIVIASISASAALGGLLMFAFVPDGPYLAKGSGFDPHVFREIFRSPGFRASAFGYFGHMWELYALWAFVPVLLGAHAELYGKINVSLWSFLVIAAGAVGCVVGGLVSLRNGSARVASVQLLASGACCVVSPLFFFTPAPLFLAFLLFWGMVVVGDSPQFSALNARYAPHTRVGSALTIANCIGFSISIVSVQLLNSLAAHVPVAWLFLPLTIGPVLGLIALKPLLSGESVEAELS
jgi:predicted MFS family arabinose efflux permease